MKSSSLSLESLASLGERERRMLLGGLAVAAALLVFGVIIPLDGAVAHASERLAKKRADLAWMQSVAPELALAPPPAVAGGSLPVVVDRTARESGLTEALHGTEAAGAAALSVRLEKAPFDVMIAWLARLSQQNGISVESATIEKTDAPGLVNAALVLHSG